MHIRTASASLALIWSSAAMPATATLQPAENWHIDYGATQCTAARSFGDPSAPVVLGIVPALSGSTYQLLVSVPRPGSAFAHESKGSVDFGQGGIPSATLHYGDKGVAFSVYQFRIPAAAIEQASNAPMVTVQSADGADYSFALSNMPALLGGLRNCTADLQRYWNLGGAGTRSAAQAKTGDVRSIFTAADYPAEVLQAQRLGKPDAKPAQYQLLVDEHGAVVGCDVLDPSGAPALDANFCDVVKHRARFTPARDSAGRAVRSVVTTPVITWADENALNSGCVWQGSQASVFTTCQRSEASRVPPYQAIRAPTSPPSSQGK